MSLLLPGAREQLGETPPESVELEVCSRRRSRLVRRWAVRIVGGLVAFLAIAVVLPPALGFSRHTVTDDAMSGTLERGSVVFARTQPVGDLEVGDIITFRPPTDGRDDVVTRRIVEIDSGLIRTGQDSTGEVDPWALSFEQLTRERAVLDIPYAGYVYDGLSRAARAVARRLPAIG